MLPILRWPDPRLGTVCDPVITGQDQSQLIADMFDTMYDASGRGLAAPQVGVMNRLFVIDVTWKEGPRSPMAFLNPRILETSEACSDGEEACLSIPGITTLVTRPDWVVLAWQDGDGGQHARRFDGVEARCVQHELDHLNGIVTLLHLDPMARRAADAAYMVQT